jgi:hypothetical protein
MVGRVVLQARASIGSGDVATFSIARARLITVPGHRFSRTPGIHVSRNPNQTSAPLAASWRIASGNNRQQIAQPSGRWACRLPETAARHIFEIVRAGMHFVGIHVFTFDTCKESPRLTGASCIETCQPLCVNLSIVLNIDVMLPRFLSTGRCVH